MKHARLASLSLVLVFVSLAAISADLLWGFNFPKPNQHGDFTYSIADAAVTIDGYSGTGGHVTIPDTINKAPVTAIGASAFAKHVALTNVVIPARVTNIGDGAFQGCTGLTSVTIPAGITNIGDRMFSDCTALTATPHII